MGRRLACVGGVLLLLAACARGRGADYDVATLVLPEGDAVAGREAFLRLDCATCHAVEWEAQFPAPHSARPGPELDRTLALETSGSVATSILVPSHSIPGQARDEAGGQLSPMGDFTEAMTVRQLIDVVAYLRSRGEATVARESTGFPATR
jgi:mono/diheme cytochrome c family protein